MEKMTEAERAARIAHGGMYCEAARVLRPDGTRLMVGILLPWGEARPVVVGLFATREELRRWIGTRLADRPVVELVPGELVAQIVYADRRDEILAGAGQRLDALISASANRVLSDAERREAVCLRADIRRVQFRSRDGVSARRALLAWYLTLMSQGG